jgi:4-amino-4-deoxy-L-arabinose transferase-like glycosyltransferase
MNSPQRNRLQQLLRPPLPLFILLLIILLAFALRAYDLDSQSMWSDEGLSLYRARQSVGLILANTITVDGVVTQDTNPPFYFLLLHALRALAGESVFALRLLGVYAGVLGVPLLYLLGRRGYATSVGLGAALLLTLSPFHVWQSQVLRNYSLLVTLNLLSVYGAFRFLLARRPGEEGGGARRSRTRRWLTLWLLAGLLGIYTHYFSFFVFAFTLLALLLGLVRGAPWRRWLRRPLVWLAVLAAAAMVLLPAVVVALSRFAAGQQVDFYHVPWHHVVNHALSAFSVGMSPVVTHPTWRLLPAVLLALVGIALGWRRRKDATLLFLGYQLIPLLILLLLSTINPLYNGVRHLLFVLPPFLLFVAAGAILPAREVPRRALITVAALLLASQSVHLWTQFHDEAYVRDDVRGVADYLNGVAAADDEIVLHDSLIAFTFDYYYDGAAAVTSVPRYGQQDVAAAESRMEMVGDRASRVWFLDDPTPRTGFPVDALPQWTDDHWLRVASRRFPALWLGQHLTTYVPNFIAAPPPAADSVTARWPDVLDLLAYEAPQQARAGEDWWVDLYLMPLGTLAEEYELSFIFEDDAGQGWAQIDQPLEAHFPDEVWPQGKTIHYAQRVPVPAGLPLGSYRVALRLVRRADYGLVPLSEGGQQVVLGEIAVTPSDCDVDPAVWPVQVSRSARMGNALRLMGYSQPAGEYRPGHLLALDFLWCVRRQPEEAYRVRLQMVDEQGNVVAEKTEPLATAGIPVTSWQPDELILSKIGFAVPASALAGNYRLHLSLLPAKGTRPLAIDWPFGGRVLPLDAVQVVPWPLRTTFPPIATPLRADFGQPPLIELHGYELVPERAAPGAALALTLYWRSTSDAISINYSVFVHLVGPGGQPLAQASGPPDRGFRVTTSWREGEVIVDQRTLTLPADISPGEYPLTVGFYDPDSGQRLPVSVGGIPQDGDAALLQYVTVAPE